MLAWPWLAVTLAEERCNDRWFGSQNNNNRCCVVVVQEPTPRNDFERRLLKLNPNAKLNRTGRNRDVRCDSFRCR